MANEGDPWLVDVCVPAEVAAMEGGGAGQLVTVEAPDGSGRKYNVAVPPTTARHGPQQQLFRVALPREIRKRTLPHYRGAYRRPQAIDELARWHRQQASRATACDTCIQVSHAADAL
eukprot:SAG25_NODE_718_length_5748_cov_8.933794_2_plen_117_part_00